MTGIIVLTWKMSERFTDTLIKKRTREIPNMIVIRRFFISLGRITGTLITIFTISIFGIHNLEFALRLIGVIFLSYPIVLYYKR